MNQPNASADAPPDPWVSRWVAATILVFYGLAKLNGSQFTVLDSELDKPMGAVNGFWLTWHYFGFSPFYGTLIAFAEVGTGLALTSRRTALAGALIAFPVAVNIVVIDFAYGIANALLPAIVLLALLIRIMAPHGERLLRMVLLDAPHASRAWVRWPARAGLLLGAFAFTYWVANHNNREPTEVDGVWTRAAVQAPGVAADLDKVFFERNRAHLAVLKDTAGNYRWRHFEVDSAGRVGVWAEWLEKGDLLYEAAYALDPARIRLWPVDEGPRAAVAFRRAREAP